MHWIKISSFIVHVSVGEHPPSFTALELQTSPGIRDMTGCLGFLASTLDLVYWAALILGSHVLGSIKAGRKGPEEILNKEYECWSCPLVGLCQPLHQVNPSTSQAIPARSRCPVWGCSPWDGLTCWRGWRRMPSSWSSRKRGWQQSWRGSPRVKRAFTSAVWMDRMDSQAGEMESFYKTFQNFSFITNKNFYSVQWHLGKRWKDLLSMSHLSIHPFSPTLSLLGSQGG